MQMAQVKKNVPQLLPFKKVRDKEATYQMKNTPNVREKTENNTRPNLK